MNNLCKLICRVDQAFWVFLIKAVYCDEIDFTISGFLKGIIICENCSTLYF